MPESRQTEVMGALLSERFYMLGNFWQTPEFIGEYLEKDLIIVKLVFTASPPITAQLM